MKRVEKDPEGGWIARRYDGAIITDEHWRWNSRSSARCAVAETDMPDRRRQHVEDMSTAPNHGYNLMKLNPTQHDLLKAIVTAGDAGVLAADLGNQLFSHISAGRSRSAMASQNAWQLIRLQLVTRKRVKRGRALYAYFATEAGKAAIK